MLKLGSKDSLLDAFWQKQPLSHKPCTFEDMVASLTWPCTLPPGWSVEWDASPANDDNTE
jgi:hypothetical protein